MKVNLTSAEMFALVTILRLRGQTELECRDLHVDRENLITKLDKYAMEAYKAEHNLT